MTAIPASSVSLKTMADGTLRMSFDIEPAQAKDAFALFAAPGTPVAIAALKQGYEAKSDEQPVQPVSVPKIGPLGYWLVCRCNEPEFWAFLNELGYVCNNGADAAAIVKIIAQVKSRKDVDGDAGAEYRCNQSIRYPYQKWLLRRGVTA